MLFSSDVLNKIIFFLCFCGVAGCTVGPNYQKPDYKLPAAYTFAGKQSPQQNANIQWWQSLNDPLLISLINQALNGNNSDIQKAQAKVREARATLGMTGADNYPQLNTQGKISRDHLSANSEALAAIPTDVPLHYTNYALGFDASWEIDFFGHTRRSTESAKARLESAIESQHAVAIATAAEVAHIYTQYRLYQQRIAIAKDNVASINNTARLVRLQMQAGSATDIDLQRIESQALVAQATLPPLEAEARVALAALAVLVGNFPEDLYTTLNQPGPIPRLSAQSLAAGLPSDLLQNRPDVRIAERDLAAATADVGVATANQFPRFQLIGNLGMDTVVPGTYAQAASHYWSLGPQFTLPIFQGGRLKNAVKQAEAARDIALANYRQAILQALDDVESALVRYDCERVKERELQASYLKLKSTVRLVKLQYKAGEASLMEVLDVERQLDQINDQYAQSKAQVVINLIALYKALGGGWSIQNHL